MRILNAIVFVSTLFLISCGSNEFDTDISEVKLADIKFKLLYDDVFTADTLNLSGHINKMNEKYGTFYNKYATSTMKIRGVNDSSFNNEFKSFIRDKDMRSIFNDIKKNFSKDFISDLESELTQAFRRAKKLFQDTLLPKQFILMSSGLNYRNVNIDSTLAIGLEYYLGENCSIYNMMQPPIPVYKRRLMDKKYISRDAVMAWVLFKFDTNEPEKNLLESMVEAGRFFYCAKRLLPELQDSLLFGYTSAQIEYCEKYEKDIWKFFSEKNRLYVNDMKEIMAYNSDGPFTAAISKDCPPAIARYIGYKIVCAYMRKNNDLSVSKLMVDSDFQKIMTRAKYRP
ncbi:MAG: hypothetical protein ACK452_03470 [Bacteroidota bacterium]|jgi:hypothetical protein